MRHWLPVIVLGVILMAFPVAMWWVADQAYLRQSRSFGISANQEKNAECGDKGCNPPGHGDPPKSFRETPWGDPITWLTFVLVLLNALLAGAGIFQGRQMRHQIRLGRDEFNATHRPRIVIHSFGELADRETIRIEFTYVNAGTTPATIFEIGTAVFSGDPAAISASGMGMHIHKLSGKLIAGGQIDKWLIEPGITQTSAAVGDMRKSRGFSTDQLICVGYVAYADASGAQRRTGFCRTRTTMSRTWLRVENSDHEYSY